jgi:hypothetical protein
VTAPRTRIEEGSTEFERDLLRSWSNEAPSSGSRQNVVKIGVTGALAGATSVAKATGGAGAAIAGALAPKWSLLAVGKWIATGAVVVSSAMVAAPYVRSLSTSSPQAAVVTSPGLPVNEPAKSEPPPIDRSPRNEVIAEPAAMPDGLGEPAAAPSAPAPSGPSEPTPLKRTPSHRSTSLAPVRATPLPEDEPPAAEKRVARGLGEQVVSLDKARTALNAGDSAEAIRLIDDYETRFPNGSLSQEATILRIEALSKLGKRSEAAELGARFVAAHPSHPYAAKLERLLGAASNR